MSLRYALFRRLERRYMVRSIHSQLAEPAHDAIKSLWTKYMQEPTGSNLEVYTLSFSRWESPSAHLDEDDNARGIWRSTTTFEGTRKQSQLTIKARDRKNTITTHYDEKWSEDDRGIHRVTFVERLPNGTATWLAPTYFMTGSLTE